MTFPLALVLCLGQVDAGEVEAPDAGAAPAAALPSIVALPSPIEGLAWSPRAEVFGEYQVGRADSVTYNQFAVPRVHVGVEAAWHGAMGRVLLEGARSTEGGALLGTAGDSIVVRLREGWGGYRWRFLEARLGMIPIPLIAELERAFAFRPLTPDGLELYRLSAPADLGATLRVDLPRRFGWLALTFANGEGYTFRELDAGKNVEGTVVGRPIGDLEVVVSGRIGSTGISGARSNRVGGGVLWAGERLGAGLVAHYAMGLRDDGGLRALLLQAFVRGTLFDRVLLAGRVHRFQRDLDAAADDSITELFVSAGVHVVGPLDVFVCFQRSWASPLARAAVPGADSLAGRLVVRLRFPDVSPLDLPGEPP